MSTIIDKLKDKFGNFVLPVTNTKAVYDDDGNRLDNTLITINSNASNALSVANSKANTSLVSDAYNSSTTYSAGQYCIYNNTLWKSRVNNNAGNTPINGTYWEATNVGNEINKDSKWIDVTSQAVSLSCDGIYSIRVLSNGKECIISGEYNDSNAQIPNNGWIPKLNCIRINAGYRPSMETALNGFNDQDKHAPILWYLNYIGEFSGLIGSTTPMTRFPIIGRWLIGE